MDVIQHLEEDEAKNERIAAIAAAIRMSQQK